jgi:hypothetical protein
MGTFFSRKPLAAWAFLEDLILESTMSACVVELESRTVGDRLAAARR